MIFLVVALAALVCQPSGIDAQGCSAYDPSTCGGQTCCANPGQGPPCYWLEIYIPYFRKRSTDEISSQENEFGFHGNHERPLTGLALELSQAYHLGDEANFTRFLNGEVPVLPRHLQLRNRLVRAMANGRKRQYVAFCTCTDPNFCCPSDCVPTGWTDWSGCSSSCGGGTRYRTLSSSIPESCGGTPCYTNMETESCDSGPCPVNCQVSSWSGWTCNAPCGSGTEHRSRYITVPEAYGGSCPEAGYLSDSRPCDAGCCPVNCVVGGWTSWSGCSAGCGGGSRSRSRTISPHSCGGSCGESGTSQDESCNTHCCPVNCAIGGWSSWGACSAPCGGGSQSRSRSISPESCGGSCSTSVVSDSQSCNTGCCPQHCQVSSWTPWSTCSQTCGSGTHTRTRSITVSPACGGSACPSDLSESEGCGGSCCAANCVLNAWSSWTGCSVTCGSGTRTRSRTKQSPETCGGTCESLSESDSCTANGGCCPVDCVWSAFTAWSGCSVTCGAGTQTRSRTLQSTQSCGGSCPGVASESIACMLPACAQPPVDCEVSTWSAWAPCTATCGTSATKSRSRTVMKAAMHGGTPCPTLSESVNCGHGCCPVNCITSNWSAWAACSVTCGSGTRGRSRTVTTDAMCNGTPCPSLSDTEPCSAAACAVNCSLSSWANWSACSQTCGTGERRRTRSVVVSPANGGTACDAVSESQPCTQAACACAVSDWSTWSPCTVTCGAGTTMRTRNVTMTASDCPALSDSKSCNAVVCPRDCAVGQWSAWSACSVSCGGGRRERTRAVTQAQVGSGAACPSDLTLSEECATTACTPPGLACTEYSQCTDCTDQGKTAPRSCQFCMNSDSGVCQSLHVVEGNASSALQACPVGFNARSTTISGCPVATTTAPVGGATTVAPTTTEPEVIESVDVSSALNLAMHETAAMADVMLSGGVRLQVRVTGEQGAMLRALGSEGLGVYSPSRDGAVAANATNMHGRLRAGLSMVFLFAKDRPVSFRRLVLGAWDATDSAQLEIANDEFAMDTTTTVATTTTEELASTTAASDANTTQGGGLPGLKKRQLTEMIGAVVLIRQAESSFETETAAGFTKYVISASGDSDFSVKSFEFVVRKTASTLSPSSPGAPDESRAISPDASGSGGLLFDVTTIALIAVAAALCLLIVIVIIAVIARRRRSRGSAASGQMQPQLPVPSASMAPVALSDHYRSMDEMRPALVGPDSSLARTLSASDVYQSLSTSQHSSQHYKEMQVERSDSYQPLPAGAGPAPAVSARSSGIANGYASASQTMALPMANQPSYQPMQISPSNRYDAPVGGTNNGLAFAIAGAQPPQVPARTPPGVQARGYGNMNISHQ